MIGERMNLTKLEIAVKLFSCTEAVPNKLILRQNWKTACV